MISAWLSARNYSILFLSKGPKLRMTASDTETCRWQMERGTDLPSRHPIEFLAAAYGLYDVETRTLLIN